MSIIEDSPTEYIIECNLEYPARLHDDHSVYPSPPEHLTISPEMLSPFCENLAGEHWMPSEKLMPNLCNKFYYVAHYRNLQFYIKHIKKMDRSLHCSTTKCQVRVRSRLDKLQMNSSFDKIMENVQNRQNIRVIADPAKLLKAVTVSKPSFRETAIINLYLVMVRAARQKVLLDKPIAVGFCILELSKLIMYKFYYDYMKLIYADRCMLLFTDRLIDINDCCVDRRINAAVKMRFIYSSRDAIFST